MQLPIGIPFDPMGCILGDLGQKLAQNGPKKVKIGRTLIILLLFG
jgi:hypothetical protein